MKWTLHKKTGTQLAGYLIKTAHSPNPSKSAQRISLFCEPIIRLVEKTAHRKMSRCRFNHFGNDFISVDCSARLLADKTRCVARISLHWEPAGMRIELIRDIESSSDVKALMKHLAAVVSLHKRHNKTRPL